ncbi:MAG TPA: hypothetical protein VGR47_19080 [Terracidiphilus sp.]|nr:hypothetical protein [Terracidiphilus sp.]
MQLGSKPDTLEDVLHLMMSRPLPSAPLPRKIVSADRIALTAAAGQICEFFAATGRITIKEHPILESALRKRIRIVDLVDIRRALHNHLKSRHLTSKEIIHTLRKWKCFIRAARRLGWTPAEPALMAEWAPMIRAMVGFDGLQSLINHAIARGRHTWEYTQEDQDLWGSDKGRDGATDHYVRSVFRRFRAAVRKAELESMFPKIDCQLQSLPPNRMTFAEMTLPLRRQVLRFFSRRRQFATRCKTKLTPPTERFRIHIFQSLCWYAGNVLKIDPLVSLDDQVLTEKTVRGFVLWLHKERDCNYASTSARLSFIHSALKKHPDYWDREWRWILDALKQIQEEHESAKDVRRSARIINYKELLTIIRRMRQARFAAIEHGSPEDAAWLVHDQLLFMCIALAHWLSQGVCICRVNTPQANLYKQPFRKENMPADLQKWVSELLAKDPDTPIWQIHLDPEESRLRATVHQAVHNFLIPLLEEYMKVDGYRDHLLAGRTDPGTLFFSRRWEPLTTASLAIAIGNLTVRFGSKKKRILPSSIPVIFANYWERKYPGKHERLASMLGQRITYVREKFKRKA